MMEKQFSYFEKLIKKKLVKKNYKISEQLINYERSILLQMFFFTSKSKLF